MIDKNYVSVVENIKEQIRSAKHKAILNANKEMLILYWNIGKIINENSTWGSKFLKNLSEEIKNEFPSAKGFSQFIRSLYGITDELRYNKLSTLLNSSLQDVVSSGKEICQNAQDGKSVIIFTKTEENAGKIVDLDL